MFFSRYLNSIWQSRCSATMLRALALKYAGTVLPIFMSADAASQNVNPLSVITTRLICSTNNFRLIIADKSDHRCLSPLTALRANTRFHCR
jgi:hypothetical protein